MLKSKLLEFMSHMDQKQLQRFGEFLASPYFVKDDKLYLFFQAIRKYARI